MKTYRPLPEEVTIKKSNNGSWEVFSHGGTQSTKIDALDWLKEVEKIGAGELLITSMDKDGTKSGFDCEFLAKVTEKIKLPVIASGGDGNLKHFKEAIEEGNASAVLAASVFHFGELTIAKVKEYLISNNIPMRP